jgi:hypothetical protein
METDQYFSVDILEYQGPLLKYILNNSAYNYYVKDS